MGSLPEGTLCAYCFENEAGYIPDGCCGPLCFFDVSGSSSCWDIAQDLGWGFVEKRRLSKLWRATLRRLGKVQSIGPLDGMSEVGLRVSAYLWDV